MGFKGYPACVFFFFAIAVSFLAMGRVALRARDFERARNSSAANPWRAKVLASEPDVPSLPSLTAELQPRPPGLTTPRISGKPPRRAISTAAALRAACPSASSSLRAGKFFFAHHF